MKPSSTTNPQDTEPQDSLPASERPSGEFSSKQKPKSSWETALSHFKTDITLEHADIPIIACCLASGLCDSSAYNAWSCFVSMQTGNTIFLALGASGQPISKPYGWLKSLTSILSFLLGCFLFASTRLVRPQARGTLTLSFLLQSLFIIISALLVQLHIVPEPTGLIPSTDINFLELLPLGFLAFQSGGQIVTSRLLGFNEVPTTVLTSVYCDLASDPRLVKGGNVKRNRRAAAVVAILVGGIAGGWISRSKAGLAASLWVAAGIKVTIALGWSMWKPKPAIQI